ncbi:DUF4252 domain-containing protein [Flagellimonas sp. DF-77]|uniref:DUF4252 domain-containing protein n=1 Tax=Flagellimonas algarum TaxID=3230298 RepID=UPI003396C067
MRHYTIKSLIAVLILLPSMLMAQSVFDRFENADNIGSVTVNKGMLGIVASMSADDADQDTRDFIDLAKSIDNIKVFVSEDKKASADMAAAMKKYVKSSTLEELMKVRDGDTNVRFYVKTGKDADHVSELLMFVTGVDGKKDRPHFETVLMTMTGDIDLNKVGALVNKMNMPKQLKKVEKKR